MTYGILNADQSNAFQDVINFLNDPNEKFHRVTGGPGTGKSFFIQTIAQNARKFAKTNPLNDTAVTATTNKAAAVLRSTGLETKTIYSHMCLRVANNYNTGATKVIPTKKYSVKHHELIIIDEASMISQTLWNHLNKGTDSTCKILLVGDQDQLDPVKENTSPAFLESIPTSYLNTPIRNSNQPALMDLVTKARETVLNKKFFPIQEVKGVIDLVSGSQVQGLIERDYHTETNARRILCYRNEQVHAYNAYVRKIRGYTEPYTVGEILTNNESHESFASKQRLYADQIIQVKERDIPYLDSHIIPGHEVRMIPLVVKDVDTNQEYFVSCFEDMVLREKALKHFSQQKNWIQYFYIKENVPDLRSVAASTVHKAQGSTYDDVIVDLKDIGRCTQVEMASRLLYVALSRAKNRVFIRGELPARFFK